MGGSDHEGALAVELVEDRVHLLPRMLRGGAGEILSRLSDNDPLRLYEFGTRRARERFLLYDADRLFHRLVARVPTQVPEPNKVSSAWLGWSGRPTTRSKD